MIKAPVWFEMNRLIFIAPSGVSLRFHSHNSFLFEHQLCPRKWFCDNNKPAGLAFCTPACYGPDPLPTQPHSPISLGIWIVNRNIASIPAYLVLFSCIFIIIYSIFIVWFIKVQFSKIK